MKIINLSISGFMQSVSRIIRERKLRRKYSENGVFDAGYYLDRYPDVQESGMSPLLHYIRFGILEGRSPLPGLVKNEPHYGVSVETEGIDEQNINIAYTLKVIFPVSLHSYRVPPQCNPGPVNTYFDEVYLLNLKSRSDRLLSMLFKLRDLNIQVRIVEAINGAELPHIYEYQQYARLPLGGVNSPPWEKTLGRKAIVSPGAWGLLKTWRMVLHDARAKGYKRILILEDDAVFIREFDSAFRAFIRNIDGLTWKILALGVSQHQWEIPENMVFGDPSITEYDTGQPWYHPVSSKGTFAIGLDCTIIPLILDVIELFDRPTDRVLHTVYHQMTTQCFVPLPNLIIADVRDSDIQQLSPAARQGFASKQKWNPDRYDFTGEPELVSVIIPAFNAESAIGVSLKSVMNQTYKNLEIIVVDDCSADNTSNIVQSLARDDSRIKYIRHPENLGNNAARNTGIRLSRGKYIANMDADDIVLPERITLQLIPIVAGRAKFTMSQMIRSHITAEQISNNQSEDLLQFTRTFGALPGADGYPQELPVLISLGSMIIERSMFEKYGLFPEERLPGDSAIAERFLFMEKGIRIPEEYTGVNHYLSIHRQIEGLFYLLDDILLISTARQDRI